MPAFNFFLRRLWFEGVTSLIPIQEIYFYSSDGLKISLKAINIALINSDKKIILNILFNFI